jgi:plasmid stabilization system protein ParE
MARVVYTAEAERNLDDIFDYIARENHRPAAAAKVLRGIDQKCRLYARFPFASQSRDDLSPGAR